MISSPERRHEMLKEACQGGGLGGLTSDRTKVSLADLGVGERPEAREQD